MIPSTSHKNEVRVHVSLYRFLYNPIFAIVMLTVVFLSGCSADSSAQIDSEEKEQKSAEQTQISSSEADKQAIMDFIDATSALKDHVEKHTYSSLSQEGALYLAALQDFEKAADSTNSEYSEYIKKIVGDPIYDGLKELCADKEQLEDPIQKMGAEYVIAGLADMLLDTELPFEYESETVKENASNEAKIDACRKTIFAAIDQGVNMYNDNAIEATLKEPVSLQCTNGTTNCTLIFNSCIHYSLPDFWFSISFEDDSDNSPFANMRDFSISNGKESIDFNSTRLNHFAYWHDVFFYFSDYGDDFNEKYAEIKAFINSNDHLSFSIDNEWTMQVPDEMVQTLRDWFRAFDTMRIIVEGK